MIITEPTVTVLSTPYFVPHSRYKLPKGEGTSGERLIAHAGKGCYDAYGIGGRSIKDHIKTLISSGHGSVLEHANYSLFIEGVSRGLSHEMVRHRAGFAYSQRSTRYVDEGECNVVLEPYMASLYLMGSEINSRYGDYQGSKARGRTIDEDRLLNGYIESLENSVTDYINAVESLLELCPPDLGKRDKRKWARGKARQLLPIALETRLTVTANLRAWRHFIIMRSSRYAEPEIRRLAETVMNVLCPLAPNVFSDINSEIVQNFPEFTSENPKI